MASSEGLVRALVAACLLGTVATPAIGLMMALPAGQVARRIATQAAPDARDTSMFDFAAAKAGWVDEFERFAARHSAPDLSDRSGASDRNVLIVAKAVPGFDAPVAGAVPQSIEPKDAPKAESPTASAPVDDALLKTGSIKSQTIPLLPPVPGPEAFKVHKSDRLGAPQRIDPSHTAPSAVDGAPDAAAVPHAELAPTKTNPALVSAGKSAMLLPARSDRLKPFLTASVSRKPMDLAPDHPDAFFQGPPMPSDPTIDADAPVLGYAEQMASAEAPFKALFAVSKDTRRSWLSVDAPEAKAKPPKPTKVAHGVPHRRNRKHDG